jgi:hypothetical protein
MWHLRKIPQIAHFYWGNETLSFLRYLTIASFKKFNPDWQIKYYYPKYKYCGEKTWSTQEHNRKFTGVNYMDQLMKLDIEKIEIDFSRYGMNNWVPETFKADFLRWYLLYNHGGFWSDMDIIYFRPMNRLCSNTNAKQQVDTAICLREMGPDSFHSIGFLLSAPSNPFFLFIHGESYRRLDLGNYQSIGSQILNQHFPSLSTIQNRFPLLNIENIPMDVVYPWNDLDITKIYSTSSMQGISERTIGLHWYAGHPAAKEFENVIDDQNFFSYSNILGKVIGLANTFGGKITIKR